MKHSKLFLFACSLVLSLFAFQTIEAQATKSQSANSAQASTVEVIQFHSTHRCMTCNKIEKLTRETVADYNDISFSLVNVDEKENEEQAEAFEAFGTALFLHNPKTGEKKNLTDFAFMNAGNKGKFMDGLKEEISTFRK